MAGYRDYPVDSTVLPNFSNVAGKTVVITGASSGLGLCYALEFVKSGAFVVNCDIKPPEVQPLPDRMVFVKCDVSSWEDQLNVFRVAKEKSPSGGIDIVIANAGIYGPDTLDGLDDDEPHKPVTKLLDVNLLGVIYTSKLAGWYFHHQSEERHDRCLILVSSIMGYIDTQGSSVYSAAKHGVRGLMTALRRKSLLRVNCLAPWFIATPIMPESFVKSAGSQFRTQGVDFALTEDAVRAAFRIATDTSINGRTLGIVPRQLSPLGYLDFEVDDFKEGSPLDKLQRVASSLVYGSMGISAT